MAVTSMPFPLESAPPSVVLPSVSAAHLFCRDTRAIVYILKPHPIQRMLDFDFVCRKEVPSIVGIWPFVICV